MARSWSGFLPQNQDIIEQFNLLDTDPRRILEALEFVGEKQGEDCGLFDEEDFVVEFPKPH
jgi:hypothetical protein